MLLSIRQQDEAAFERNFNQLRVYYTDARRLLPPSDQEALLLSLNLLRLLVQNRIAEFHTELELLPAEVRAGRGTGSEIVTAEHLGWSFCDALCGYQ